MADNGDPGKTDGSKADAPPAKGNRAPDERTEWTASDYRGPLNAADPEGGIAGPAAETELATSSSAAAEEAPISSATPPQSAAVEPDQRRQVPALPIIGALIVGAIIGAGSAAIVYQYGGQGQGDAEAQVNALSPRVDALEKRADPQPQLDALKTAVDKLGAEPKPAAFDPGPLQQKITGLEGDIDGLKKQDADSGVGDKVAALGTAVAALKAQVADAKGLDDKVSGLAATVDGLKNQDETAGATIASLQSGQKTLEGKITTAPALAVVADSLVEAISRGQPYAGQVDALGSLGADPAKIAVLRENADKGVPSAQALAQKFAPLAAPIMATAAKAPPNASMMDRLKSGVMSMVAVRSADSTAGDDVGSRVSRIEADLAHDDVAGAYATWDGLPADAKAKSDAWGALAKTTVEALGSARALQQQAIATLGNKKS